MGIIYNPFRAIYVIIFIHTSTEYVKNSHYARLVPYVLEIMFKEPPPWKESLNSDLSLSLSEMSGVPENMNLGQCLNPAFVHSIAVPQTDKILGASYKICAVARGDGIVDVIDLESELRPLTKPRSKNGVGQSANCNGSGQKRIHLDYSSGGHTAAVSCVYVSVKDCNFIYNLHF